MMKKIVVSRKTFAMDQKILTFGELAVGKKFIGFPTDGDNRGHGGYLGPYNIFTKLPQPNVNPDKKIPLDNAKRSIDGVKSHMPDTMQILQVQ